MQGRRHKLLAGKTTKPRRYCAAVAAFVVAAVAAPVAAAAAVLYSAKFREDRGLAGLTYGGDPAMCAISRAQRLLLLLLDLESNLLSSSLAQWKKIWL